MWLLPVLLVVFCDLERGSMSLVSILWWDRKRVNSGQLAVIPGQLVAFFFYFRAWIIFWIKEILACLLGTLWKFMFWVYIIDVSIWICPFKWKAKLGFWNNIDVEIKTSRTITMFKKMIKISLLKTKIYILLSSVYRQTVIQTRW